MKKIITLFFAVLAAVSSWATTFTFTSSSSVSQTKDGITISLSKASGNNDPFFSSSEEMRLYAKNTITVSGANLISISLTFAKQGSKEYATLSASTGNLSSGGTSSSNTDLKTDLWTGSSNSVTFTLGDTGQRIITQIVVNGTGGEGGDSTQPSNPGQEEDDDDSSSGLDPDYTYAEPKIVSVPNKTVQGDSYWFISNNIQVSCTKGAVTDTYFSAHAGFDMSFSATRPIKGLVINGFVKKDFEGTVNHGKVSFISPDADTEGSPVVVITDVDSKTVTISCVKQLRCYNVEIYFDENPDKSVGAGSGSGSSSSTDLVFDTAEAVYESEYVEWINEENYSIFLYNAAQPYYPYIALDIYPAAKDVLEGTYRMSDYSLGDFTYYVYGDGDDDMTWALSGDVTITRSGSNYTIAGYIGCDNGVRYNFTFTGNLPVYLDSDYYYGDDEGSQDSVREITPDRTCKPALDPEAPMHNLQGQRITGSYRGVIIQNGHKYILR